MNSPLFIRQSEPVELRLVLVSPSLSAEGTAIAPTSGRCGPGVGAPDPLMAPTVADLEAIEAEWPVIEAEVALVDAECRYLLRPSAVTRAAVKTAEAVVIRAHLSLANTRTVVSIGAQS